MKGLLNFFKFLYSVGASAYDPNLHQFTLLHFWQVTKLFFFATCFFFLLLLCWVLGE